MAGGQELKRIKRYREHWYRVQGALCWWCKNPVPPERMTAEHMIERSKGGKTTRENIRMACPDCNWRRSNGYQHNSHVKAYRRHRWGTALSGPKLTDALLELSLIHI